MQHLKLLEAMMEYYSGDSKRIQHFLKVYEFSRIIGQTEHISADTQFSLEVAAIVHDIGIKSAEEKYGRCGGKLQEKEGPSVAENMLSRLGYDKHVIDRVCYLVGHHHTYTNIDGADYQILVEADFLVNMYEDNLSKESIENACQKVFKTESGIQLCKVMYGI